MKLYYLPLAASHLLAAAVFAAHGEVPGALAQLTGAAIIVGIAKL